MLSGGPVHDYDNLKSMVASVYIGLFRGGGPTYLPDRITDHRQSLREGLKQEGLTYRAQDYTDFEGESYPIDLSGCRGVWNERFPKMENVQVIDLDVMMAVYWLLPLFSSASDDLRRIIFRNSAKFEKTAFRIPLEELDLGLLQFPEVKVILLDNSSAAWNYFKRKLPLLYHRKGIQTLSTIGMFIQINSIKGKLLSFNVDLRAPDTNVFEYRWDPRHDPFGRKSQFNPVREGKRIKKPAPPYVKFDPVDTPMGKPRPSTRWRE
jgi:hypothetical protein